MQFTKHKKKQKRNRYLQILQKNVNLCSIITSCPAETKIIGITKLNVKPQNLAPQANRDFLRATQRKESSAVD
jgi:hypothetical protein